MNYSCISDFTYLDSPEFVFLAFHVSGLIETPFHVLGFYCILFKTPEQMKSVKWYLFTLHVWIVIFDYSLSLFTAPFLLINGAAGYPLGVSKYTNIPIVVQFMMVISFSEYMMISVVSIFENRFYIICNFSSKESWKFWRRVWLATHYFMALIVPSVFPSLVPDQEVAKPRVFLKLPCLPRYVYEAPIFVVADSTIFYLVGGVLVVPTLALEVLFFVVFLSRNSLKQLKENSMSQKTYQLQKRFIIALVIQSAIPYIFIGIPLIYTGIAVFVDYFNQAIINIFLVTISSHGLLSTIAMLLLHKPYRFAVQELYFKSIRKSSEVSQVPINNQRRNTFVIAAL